MARRLFGGLLLVINCGAYGWLLDFDREIELGGFLGGMLFALTFFGFYWAVKLLVEPPSKDQSNG